MKQSEVERNKARRLLFILQQEEEKLNFFCESKYSRMVCGKYFQPTERPTPDDQQTDFNDLPCSGCGYKEIDHVTLTERPRWTIEDRQWRREHHLVRVNYAEASFKINFTDEILGLEKSADVAILAPDTHPAVLLNLLVKTWKVDLPELIVSVIGTADKFPIQPSQFKNFKYGFCRALSNCKAWILGSGTLHGVDEVITECMKEMQYLEWLETCESRFYLIAFTNWDCVDNKQPANKWFFEQEQKQPFPYFIRQRKANFDQSTQQLTVSLNPFFSHFIAVQGGVKGMKSQELEVRCMTEEFLCKALDSDVASMNPGLGIPLVQILIGGDVGNLEHVARTVSNQIPVVICQGSGGVADIILCAIRMATAHLFGDQLRPYQEKILTRRLQSLFSSYQDNNSLYSTKLMNAAPQIVHLRTCVKYRRFVTVYRMDKPAVGLRLDQCILRALLTGQTVQKYDPISLALKWNRCDDVIREILLQEGDINCRPNVNSLVTEALIESKLDFIKLFTDLGFEFSSFLNSNRIEYLYDYLIVNFDYMRAAFEPYLQKNYQQRKNSNELYQDFFQKKVRLEHIYSLCFNLCAVLPQSKVLESQDDCFQDPARELFIWAVFAARLDTAEMFWRVSRTPLALALMAPALAKSCCSYLSADEKAIKKSFVEIERTFVKHSVNLLSKALDTCEGVAMRLLARSIENLSSTRVVDIAAFVDCKEFIAHPCVQLFVEKSWKAGFRMKFRHIVKALIYPPGLLRVQRSDPENHRHFGGPDNEPDQESSAYHKHTVGIFSCQETNSLKYETPEDASETLLQNGAINSSSINEAISSALPEISLGPSCPPKKKSYEIVTVCSKFYNSSIFKYNLNLLSYFFFLGLFSWAVIYETRTDHLVLGEFVILSFNIGFLIQYLELFLAPRLSIKYRLQLWFQSEWNSMGALSTILGINAFLVKLSTVHGNISGVYMRESHCCYCISCFLAWIRLISFFIINSKMGPLWIMVRKMLIETALFLTVFGIITISAGIAAQVCMDVYEYDDPYSGSLQWYILRPYFMFNGERFIKIVKDNSDKRESTQESFVTAYSWLLVGLLWLGNALILNLLIAIFNEIFKHIFEQSDFEWKTENFCMEREYSLKTILPPPFSILESFLKLLFMRRFKGPQQLAIPQTDLSALAEFESRCASEVLADKNKLHSAKETLEHALRVIDEQKSRLNDFEAILEEMTTLIHERNSRSRLESTLYDIF